MVAHIPSSNVLPANPRSLEMLSSGSFTTLFQDPSKTQILALPTYSYLLKIKSKNRTVRMELTLDDIRTRRMK